MQIENNKRCSGLTVIELIVSLSIIAIIFSISMVSLSSARESARNMTCISNQRQIGVAISGYEAAFRVLPMNVLEEATGVNWSTTVDHHSAHVRLLPFLDNAPLMSLIAFSAKTNIYDELKLDAPSVFRCPSESKPTARSFNYCYSIGARSIPSSFLKPHESDRVGAFGTSDTRNLSSLGGRANLIFVSERSVGSRSESKKFISNETASFEQGNGKRDWYSIFFYGEPQSGYYTPNQWTQICARTLERKPMWITSTGGLWTSGDDAYFNQILPPNSQIPDCGMLVYPMHGCRTARSEHKNHVNVLFGDGSIRAIEDGIELNVWRDLGAVQKQEAAPEVAQ